MKRSIIKGISGVAALLLAVFCCVTSLGYAWEGFVNNALGIQAGDVVGSSKDAYVYKTDFTEDGLPSDEGLEKLLEAEDAYNKQSLEESAVLVYNNGALPLDSKTKNITLLGRSVIDPVYRCNGAGGGADPNRTVGLDTALKNAGYSLNQKLLDAYSKSSTARKSGGSTASIGEENISFYTQELKDTFSSYGDAAIIMFSRIAGEGVDMAKVDVDNERQLAFHQQEADLLKMVKDYKDAGVFKKVIVLINSAYAVELDWIYDSQYGVDACLWIGNPGLNGFNGVPSLLKGEVNPSGHFVDTFATNSLSAPATKNMGETTFSNSNEAYAVYAENIYIGYKYYETRYEDLILGQGNASTSKGIFASNSKEWNYADEVTFPFGYGLSYTTFKQTLDDVVWNEDNTITAKVTVTNTGSVAGMDVVELYAQLPYTDYDKQHNVEKSAIQLLDFAKTGVIEPGDSESVTITADKYLLASWDSTAHNGKGGYILDDGDYYIAIGNDVHDALNNVLAAKKATGMYDEKGKAVAGNADNAKLHVLDAFDDQTYKTSIYTDADVENQFAEGLFATDYNYFNKENGVTYLTRSDWNTFPDTIKNLYATDRILELQRGDFYDELKELIGQVPEYKLDTDAGIMFIQMKDVAWDDDEKWNEYLSQLSVGELALMASDSSGQKPLTKVNKPQNHSADGPDGSGAKYNYGAKGSSNLFVNEGTMTCSWNKEIMRLRGYYIGEDNLYNGTDTLLGPGANIHRTPYSGRNHEYFSEDGTMSYIMGATVCKAMQEKGTVAMPKHFAGNDQETNRSGACDFLTEQCLREIILRGFEGCIAKGGAMSTMMGYNCVGAVHCAHNYALMTTVMRDEWGFKGIVSTDGGDCPNTSTLAVVSGINIFCANPSVDRNISNAIKAGDDVLLNAIVKTNKCYSYTYLRSNLINGLTVSSSVKNTLEWWKAALIALDVIFGAVTLLTSGLYAYMVITDRNKLGLKKGERNNETV